MGFGPTSELGLPNSMVTSTKSDSTWQLKVSRWNIPVSDAEVHGIFFLMSIFKLALSYIE